MRTLAFEMSREKQIEECRSSGNVPAGRVLVADDHALVRRGIRALLNTTSDLKVVAEAADGREAVMNAEQIRPDIAIIDISMKQLNGIEAMSLVRRRLPTTIIIALSMFSEESCIRRAVRAGANAYVLKSSTNDELLSAIRFAQRGESFFSPVVAKALLESYTLSIKGGAPEDRYELLSGREREIFQMLAEGKTNKVIADELGLKVPTVETHRLRLMKKLDVHNMAQLVLGAVRRGVVA